MMRDNSTANRISVMEGGELHRPTRDMRPSRFAMRSRLVLALALGLALLVPATALGATPAAGSLQDTPIGTPAILSMDEGAVAYYLSPDRSQCAVVDLHWVAERPLDGELFYSQHLNVQLSDATCQPSKTSNGVDLDASDYRIVTLTYAYVHKSLTVAGHPISVDVAWTATGTPEVRSDTQLEGINVGKSVSAHLSGTVTVDGVAWTPNQQTATLESNAMLNYSGASASAAPQPSPSAGPSSSQPATTTAAPAETARDDGPLLQGLALLLVSVAVAVAYSVASGTRRNR